MPSTYAHFVFGRTMLRQYPQSIQDMLAPHMDLFQIGLHGPDILFYYKALHSNPVNRLGSSMHDVPAKDYFLHGAQVLRNMRGETQKQQARAYLLGFLCHFSLDSICHTYVEKKMEVSGLSHIRIETEYDRHLLTLDGKDPLRQHVTGHLHSGEAEAAVIAPFFDGVTPRQISEALRSMVRTLDFLVAPGAWKRELITLGLKISGNYGSLGGLVMHPRPEPLCDDSNVRMDKLMARSAGLCLRLTENYLHWLDGTAPLDPWFDHTFSAAEDWQTVPVYPLGEELKYEI